MNKEIRIEFPNSLQYAYRRGVQGGYLDILSKIEKFEAELKRVEKCNKS